MSDANAQWYYTVGSQQQGPVGVDQIRAMMGSGSLGPDTLVWTSSMTEWQPLGRTPLAASLPPASLPMGQGTYAPPTPAGYGAPMAGSYAPPGQYGTASGVPYGYAPPPSPGFMDALKIGFRKYVTWAGRATRSEFWFFYLWYMIALIVGGVIDGMIVSSGSSLALFTGLAGLAFILPQLAVTVRRLHDTDRSGWFYWMLLIPLAGPIIVIVFLCTAGTPGPNRFG